jgi:hypothetical protein
MKETRWIHPSHVRVKSPQIGDNIIGRPLTDKTIEKYQKSGWYEADAKRARLERAEKRARKKERREGNFTITDDGRMVYCPI